MEYDGLFWGVRPLNHLDGPLLGGDCNSVSSRPQLENKVRTGGATGDINVHWGKKYVRKFLIRFEIS